MIIGGLLHSLLNEIQEWPAVMWSIRPCAGADQNGNGSQNGRHIIDETDPPSRSAVPIQPGGARLRRLRVASATSWANAASILV
jgi:hypothetical protein